MYSLDRTAIGLVTTVEVVYAIVAETAMGITEGMWYDKATRVR